MKLTAEELSVLRELMPTGMSTAELRDVDAMIRARSVFTARGTSAKYLQSLKEIITLVAGGSMGENEAVDTLKQVLDALNYSPEEGFPGAVDVEPAVRGSLQDLSSYRRLQLIVETQRDLMAGASLQLRGQRPVRLEAFPVQQRHEQIIRPD